MIEPKPISAATAQSDHQEAPQRSDDAAPLQTDQHTGPVGSGDALDAPDEEPRLPDQDLPEVNDVDQLEVPGVVPSAKKLLQAVPLPASLLHALHLR